MKPSIKKKANYTLKKSSIRTKILKYLHCRQMLILICTLVVLECMCVMAELMVDLQVIRVRFDNEEQEVARFIEFMKSKNPSAFAEFEGKKLHEIMYVLRQTTSLWSAKENKSSEPLCECVCDDAVGTSGVSSNLVNRTKRSITAKKTKLAVNNIYENSDADKHYPLPPSIKLTFTENSTNERKDIARSKIKYLHFDKGHTFKEIIPQKRLILHKHIKQKSGGQSTNKNNQVQQISDMFFQKHNDSIKTNNNTYSNSESRIIKTRRKRNINTGNTANVFIFSIHNSEKDVFLISEFRTLTQSESNFDAVNDHVEQYQKIHNISHVIKYCGFGILTLMLCETLVKFACLGMGFFKKKIEVFDAFIVIVSFALDLVFIDSKWYETGKDATTILVLLLPWRVVRIVNSFLMTINHKHYIEMMTVRRAKKKSETKLKKLQHLMVEMRRDIDLLISLARTKGASEPEIAACIYGKGRGTTTLAAITSFASLMFISTLGKRDPSNIEPYDDMYGDLIRDILEDDDDDDKGTTEETTLDKDEGIEFDVENAASTKDRYSVSRSLSGKNDRKKSGRTLNVKRRVTLPRRHGSSTDDDTTVYYVNDGYETGEENACHNTNMYSKSMPVLASSTGKNFVKGPYESETEILDEQTTFTRINKRQDV